MKKFIKVLLASVMSVLIFAGCTMKVDYGFVVSSDKKVSLTVTAAYDKEMIDGLNSMNQTDGSTTELTDAERWAFMDEQLKSFSEDEYTKKKYDADGYYGYVFTHKKVKDISEVAKDSASERTFINLNSDSEDNIADSTLFIKTGENKYKSNLAVKQSSDTNYSQYESMGAAFDLTFTITLPVKPISNNATKVSDDGKTLTWDLTKATDIDFEFEFESSGTSVVKGMDNKTLIIIGIVVGAILLVVIVIIALTGKKAAPVAPVTPVQPINPQTPVQPVQPVQPVAPVAPVVPEQPVETAQQSEVQPTDDQNNTTI